MQKTYCGACRGERGCADCKAVGASVMYTGVTGFVKMRKPDAFASVKTEDCCEANDGRSSDTLLLAADLGTTTLAFVCANTKGEVLASYGAENPQRKVAADVVGRMDAALHGKRAMLVNEIREALVKGFLFVFRQGCSELRIEGVREVKEVRIALAGNTVMQHLLLDYPLDGLAKAPFTPYSVKEVRGTLESVFGTANGVSELPSVLRQAEFMVFPCVSAFVGGDAVAGANFVFGNGPAGTKLLIDLGTNGEILLMNNGRLYGTAAAMGSAFEGGRYAYASELFHLLSEALEADAVEETGLLREPYFSEGFHGLLQEDIREFQLAKGALRAGIELLCQYAKVDFSAVEEVFLAGGIGQFCDKGELFRIGLLPEAFEEKLYFVGNSCIGGMLNCLKNKESVIYCEGEILNLAEQEAFAEVYYRCMNFETAGKSGEA